MQSACIEKNCQLVGALNEKVQSMENDLASVKAAQDDLRARLELLEKKASQP